jgi:hypothetical protein
MLSGLTYFWPGLDDARVSAEQILDDRTQMVLAELLAEQGHARLYCFKATASSSIDSDPKRLVSRIACCKGGRSKAEQRDPVSALEEQSRPAHMRPSKTRISTMTSTKPRPPPP